MCVRVCVLIARSVSYVCVCGNGQYNVLYHPGYETGMVAFIRQEAKLRAVRAKSVSPHVAVTQTCTHIRVCVCVCVQAVQRDVQHQADTQMQTAGDRQSRYAPTPPSPRPSSHTHRETSLCVPLCLCVCMCVCVCSVLIDRLQRVTAHLARLQQIWRREAEPITEEEEAERQKVILVHTHTYMTQRRRERKGGRPTGLRVCGVS